MNKKEYLNEENYQRAKKKISIIALIILVVGVILGLSLIITGAIKQAKVNSQYSENSKAKLQEKLETEKKNLEFKKSELEEKIKPIENEIKKLEREPFTGFNDAYYERKDKIEELKKSIESDKKSIDIIGDVLDGGFDYCSFSDAKNNEYTSTYCSIFNSNNDDLSVIKNALDESFNWCKFNDAKNNEYTSMYCSYKLQLSDLTDFNRSFNSSKYISFYMFGAFAIIASCMVAFSIYMITKRREIIAFSAQQVMPVAQEGIEKMAPTIGKAGASIAKEMAPVYGNIAKEISKGIKEGMNEVDSNKNK